MGRKNNFHTAAIAAALAAVLPVALPGIARAGDWKLEAGVTAKETYTDNVGLSPTHPQSDFITELNPYITASKQGARLQADFRYTMQNLAYADQSSRNRTNHGLAGRAKAELWEHELFLDANASITQQITSLLGPISATTASATGNLTNVYSWTLSPYWQHRFGTTANLFARYSHSEVTYGGNAFSNSTGEGVNLGLFSGSAFNDLSWALNYSDQKTDYKNRPDVEFATTTGTLGYALTPKWRISGTMGYQDHSYAAAKTALSGSLWNVGLAWAPTIRTNLSVGYGDNPFGKTHSFDFSHRTEYSTWSADYSEALSTGSGQFTNTQFLGNLFTSTGIVPVTSTQNILTDTVFLNKRFQGSAGYHKGRSTVNLTVFASTQESQQNTSQSQTISVLGLGRSGIFGFSNTIKQRGANAAWDWRLSPVLTSTVGLGVVHLDYVDLGRRDTYSNVQVGLTRNFNADLSGNVTVRHQDRSSNQANTDASENAITGAVNYKF